MDSASVFDRVSELNLLEFYGWWQLAVCLFAFMALMGIWWHIGRKLNEFGQIWLAISILCWALSGGVEVYFAKDQKQITDDILYKIETILQSTDSPALIQQEFSEIQKDFNLSSDSTDHESVAIDGWRSVFSLFNSLFILLALPYFRYIPEKLDGIVRSKFWIHIIGWPFLFSLLPTAKKMITGQGLGLMSELDVYYGIFTIVFMGYILFESFTRRRLSILAWLSVLCCLITLVAQIYKLTSSNIDLTLYSAIFKTTLIMLFFALALSWVKELTENIIPDASKMSLVLAKVKIGNKYEHQVLLKGIPEMEDKLILFTPTLFNLLQRFANKRLKGEGWLEIRPKSDTHPNKDYDIKDHNEIKRMMQMLLDGIFGKGLWTKEKHEEPLRKTLFELSDKRERKIRLTIPAQNISINL